MTAKRTIRYIKFLKNNFSEFDEKQLNFIFPRFDLIEAIVELKDFRVDEIAVKLNASIESTRKTLKRLTDLDLLECEKIRSRGNYFLFHNLRFSKEFVEKLNKLTRCDCCDNRVNRFGGILVENLDNVYVYCSDECICRIR